MRYYEDFREILDEEVKKMVKKGDITPTDLDYADKIFDIILDIEKLCGKDDEGEYGEYSQRSGYMRNRYAQRGNTGSDGNSYGMRMPYYYDNGGSSYRSGYSRHTAKEQMRGKLEEMLDMASSDKEREAIERWMEELNK